MTPDIENTTEGNNEFRRKLPSIDRVVKLYKSGMMCKEIGAMFEASESAVSRLLNRSGIKRITKSGRKHSPICTKCDKVTLKNSKLCRFHFNMRQSERYKLKKELV